MYVLNEIQVILFWYHEKANASFNGGVGIVRHSFPL